jgi:hypothetical protein
MKMIILLMALALLSLLVRSQETGGECTNAINQLSISQKIDITNLKNALDMQQNQTLNAIKASEFACKQSTNETITLAINQAKKEINDKIAYETMPTKFFMTGILISLAVISGSRWLTARKRF